MTTATRRRRERTRLETPQAALLAVALIAVDLVAALPIGIVIGDTSCRSYDCAVNGVSVTRPLIGLAIGVALFVIPLAIAWWRGSGLATTLVVQGIAAAIFVAWAAQGVVAADAARRDPPTVNFSPSLRPCAEKTLEGHTCLTYSETPPVAPVGSP